MKKPFKLPQSFLNQLGEFTRGYYLITVNDQNEFETFFHHDDEVTEMALINYVDIQSGALQDMMRNQASEMQDDDDDGEAAD